jgi:hypothetical protein
LIDDLDTHGLAVELGSPFPAYFANQEFFVAEHADTCCGRSQNISLPEDRKGWR